MHHQYVCIESKEFLWYYFCELKGDPIFWKQQRCAILKTLESVVRAILDLDNTAGVHFILTRETDKSHWQHCIHWYPPSVINYPLLYQQELSAWACPSRSLLVLINARFLTTVTVPPTVNSSVDWYYTAYKLCNIDSRLFWVCHFCNFESNKFLLLYMYISSESWHLLANIAFAARCTTEAWKLKATWSPFDRLFSGHVSWSSRCPSKSEVENLLGHVRGFFLKTTRNASVPNN